MSAFIRCQDNCTSDAEHLCNCNFYFCNEHYQRHNPDDNPHHRSSKILIDLDDHHYSIFQSIRIADIVKESIEAEFLAKKSKVSALVEQIKAIESDYRSFLQGILQTSESVRNLLARTLETRKFPKKSLDYFIHQVANMVEMNQLSSYKLEELIANKFRPKLLQSPMSPSKPTHRRGLRSEDVRNIDKSINHEEQYKWLSPRDANSCSQTPFTFKAHSGRIPTIAVSACGNFIASGSEDKTIKIFDLLEGGIKSTLVGHTKTIRTVNFSPLGDLLVSGGDDSSAIVWNLKTEQRISYLKNNSGSVNSACFSPDSKHVAFSTAKTVIFWNIATNNSCSRALNGHSANIKTVMFTPNGRNVISGGEDGEIKIWNLDTGEAIKTLKKDCEKLFCFSLYNNLLAVGGRNDSESRIEMWDINIGERIDILQGYGGYIYSIAFSEDGQFIMSGVGDDSIIVRTISKVIRRIPNIHSPRAVFARDRIVSGDINGYIRIWNSII